VIRRDLWWHLKTELQLRDHNLLLDVMVVVDELVEVCAIPLEEVANLMQTIEDKSQPVRKTHRCSRSTGIGSKSCSTVPSKLR